MIHSPLLLSIANLRHGFTTLELAKADFDRVNSQTASVKQVHGKAVEWTDHLQKAFAEADGLGTFQKELPVGVFTADCTPILLAAIDRQNQAFAVMAVHAGWKGASQEIASHGLKALVENSGARIHRVVAALGPAISGRRFEVGQDVIDAFPGCLSYGIAEPKEGQKFWFHLQKENQRQLLATAQNLEILLETEISPHCTWSEPSLFPSWRRDREQASRILSWLAFT